MIKAILVDDELNALKGLELEMRNFYNRISVLGSYSNAHNAIEFLKKETVDVVFLDIEMPQVSGIDFLELFQNRNFHVVFTTAYSRYAIEAVKLDVVDYLLKPIDTLELEQCITRLEKLISKEQLDDKLEDALNKLNETKIMKQRIILTIDGKMVFYHPSELLYCEASGNYTNIFLANGEKKLISKQLKIIEEELPDYCFYRIHNSYLVNLEYVKEYHKNDGLVVLNNGTQLPVSKPKRNEILKRF